MAGADKLPAAAPGAEDMRAVLEAADCLFDAPTVQAAYAALARQLTAHYERLDPLVLILMVGGFVAAAELLARMRFPLQVGYLHATRYHDRIRGSEVVWKRRPEAIVAGRHVLVIDDILDEGATLVEVRRALLEEHPASLRIAVLADKLHARRADGAHAEYVGLHLPDCYVFGCGMDYRGYWRQLPAIYAVAGL